MACWLPGHAIIETLRQTGLTSMLEHADASRQLAQHPPDQATVTLSLTKILFLRSDTSARRQLGIPLPVD